MAKLYQPKTNLTYLHLREILSDDVGAISYQGADKIRADLETKFASLLQKTKRTWQVEIFKHELEYFFYVRVPSEKYLGKIYYDVVLQFTPTGSSSKVDILNHSMKIFSNAPSFLFKYAYVANKKGLIISELVQKLGYTAINTPPSKTNPDELFGFEKSIYFACQYIKSINMYHINDMELNKKIYSKDRLLRLVLSCPEKLQEYNNIKNQSTKHRAKKTTKPKEQGIIDRIKGALFKRKIEKTPLHKNR